MLSKIYKEVLQLDITNKTKIPIKKWSEELNRHFPKRWIQIAKRCLISPTIREMQFKNTGCHLTPVKMAIIKKQESSVGKDGGEGNPYHYWWECKLFHTWCKIVRRYLKSKEKKNYHKNQKFNFYVFLWRKQKH